MLAISRASFKEMEKMKKVLGLAAIVGMLGCADFHAQLPVSWYILDQGKSVEIEDFERNVTLKYTAPESGDGEMDDNVELSCYEMFCPIQKINIKVGGSGRFYAMGLLFNYTVSNDNDTDPSNNQFEFSARRW